MAWSTLSNLEGGGEREGEGRGEREGGGGREGRREEGWLAVK